MALSFFLWSRTAASNATADPAVNWAEGQAPSSVNDSARAMMASAAAYRDDVAGSITTTTSSTAYVLTSFQIFDTLAHMAGQKIAFIPHATNTNTVGNDVTLNVDGLGAKPIRMQPSVALPGGTLVLGTPYIVTYNNVDAVFYLQNMTNPYNIPLGGSLDFWGTTAPNSSFALMYGQAISRSTYATLFTLFSTTFGVGDGSTTFNIPDLRGRVVAGKDDMGGSSANRLTNADDGLNGDTLGATADHETQSLVTANHAAYTPSGSIVGTVSSVFANFTSGAVGATHYVIASASGDGSSGAGNVFSGTFTGTAQGGTSQAFGIVQPTIIGNKILRLI